MSRDYSKGARFKRHCSDAPDPLQHLHHSVPNAGRPSRRSGKSGAFATCSLRPQSRLPYWGVAQRSGHVDFGKRWLTSLEEPRCDRSRGFQQSLEAVISATPPGAKREHDGARLDAFMRYGRI